MSTNEKKKGKGTVLKLVIALVVLLVSGVIGAGMGVFNGIDGFLSMIRIDTGIVIRLIVMVSFLYLVSNVLLLFFKGLQNKKGRIGTISTVFSSLICYGSVLLGFCWGLTIIGVNVSTIFASVGIVALILGFGAESLVADLVTGVFILFENQYNVGDIIEVGGFRGTVHEIGFRTVSLIDAGGNIKIINNSNMTDIVNLSDKQSVAVCEIGISYETDLDELEKKLPKIFDAIKEEHKDVFIGEIKYLGVEELADSCVRIKIKADVAEKNLYGGRRILNKELKMAFDKEKIVIPYPQMVVHTK